MISYLELSHLEVQKRVAFPGPPCQNIAVNPLGRNSGDKLLVGGFHILAGDLTTYINPHKQNEITKQGVHTHSHNIHKIKP